MVQFQFNVNAYTNVINYCNTLNYSGFSKTVLEKGGFQNV